MVPRVSLLEAIRIAETRKKRSPLPLCTARFWSLSSTNISHPNFLVKQKMARTQNAASRGRSGEDTLGRNARRAGLFARRLGEPRQQGGGEKCVGRRESAERSLHRCGGQLDRRSLGQQNTSGQSHKWLVRVSSSCKSPFSVPRGAAVAGMAETTSPPAPPRKRGGELPVQRDAIVPPMVAAKRARGIGQEPQTKVWAETP